MQYVILPGTQMASASTEQVLAATRQWLKPLVFILIRCGVTWRELSELARTTYVEVATEKFGKRGRPTNVSRTAVLTGLSRREVRKQREQLESAPQQPTGYVTKASLVLSAWHIDPEFVNKRGRPLPIAIEGEGKTFATLVRRCGGGDVRPSTLLKELVSAGAVRVRSDGRVEAVQRNYIPHAVDEQFIRLWGNAVAEVARTAGHNLTHTQKIPPRFERSAINDRVALGDLPEFRKFLEREGQAFLERMDAWLTEHEAKNEASIRLGVGLYHIQD
jgi:Family of unknown function (DUF6502)